MLDPMRFLFSSIAFLSRIPIPAGQTVMLERGGLHVMCIGKTGEFTVGQSVPVTLTFETAGQMEVAAEVIEPGKLVISIAAGVRLERMQACLREGVGVIRVMPNTPAQVGMGASALALGKSVNQRQRDTAAGLFESVGLAVVVDEKLLDAVTGLSGSGPAFVYTFIEALADAGVSVGLTREAAIALAAQTVAGAAQMVLKTGRHPAVLRDQVTSPAGTTIAGCAELERKGLRAAVISAVQAAAARSAEMGK